MGQSKVRREERAPLTFAWPRRSDMQHATQATDCPVLGETPVRRASRQDGGKKTRAYSNLLFSKLKICFLIFSSKFTYVRFLTKMCSFFYIPEVVVEFCRLHITAGITLLNNLQHQMVVDIQDRNHFTWNQRNNRVRPAGGNSVEMAECRLGRGKSRVNF